MFMWKLFLFCFVISMQAMHDNNITSLLRKREATGQIDKRKVKNSFMYCENTEDIEDLRKESNWKDLLDIISNDKRLMLSHVFLSSYEDNSLMMLIPPALAYKTQKFKNYLLADRLLSFEAMDSKLTTRQKELLEKEVMVALVEAGADPNLFTDSRLGPVLAAGLGVNEDIEYCKALLERGADPNIAITWKGHTKRMSLSYARSVEMIELLVKHGADVHAKASDIEETFLHHVTKKEKYESKLLQVYLNHGIDVNAKDEYGCTPLEHLVMDYPSHAATSSRQELKKKVSILLDNCAHYKRAIRWVDRIFKKLNSDNQSLIREISKEKYEILRDMLFEHEHRYEKEAARLRNILLD